MLLTFDRNAIDQIIDRCAAGGDDNPRGVRFDEDKAEHQLTLQLELIEDETEHPAIREYFAEQVADHLREIARHDEAQRIADQYCCENSLKRADGTYGLVAGGPEHSGEDQMKSPLFACGEEPEDEIAAWVSVNFEPRSARVSSHSMEGISSVMAGSFRPAKFAGR